MVTFIVLALIAWLWVGYRIHKTPIIDPKYFFEDNGDIKYDEYGNPIIKD